MPDEHFELTRRRALAALGGVGLASAGAGLGTTAYFSDQETYTGNALTAGSLDIKAGWEAHYSDWSPDESEGLESDVQMEEGADISDSTRVGLPANVAAQISVDDAASAQQFLDNTQTGQYPEGYDSSNFPSGSTVDCDALGEVALTDDDGEDAAPVIDLDDVKPGDFVEVTFSFAICGNPGYVWVEGFLQSASENGVTDPEAEDPDEEETEQRPASEDSDTDQIELGEAVKVAFWLDDGNNFQNGGEQPLFVGSLRDIFTGEHPQIQGPRVRIDGQSVAASNVVPTDFIAYGVNRFDFSGDDSYDVDVELADDPVASGKVAHATSSGMPTTDYATTAVSLASAPTLGELTDDPTNPTTTLTYEYYGGAANQTSAPDEVYLFVEESDGTEHVVYRSANDGDPDAQEWRTRNVHRELAGNPDNNAGFNWFEITASGTTNLGGGGPTSDLSEVYGDDAVVRAMAAGRGTLGTSDVADVYYRNPMVGDSSEGPFPTSCFRGGGTVYNGVFAWWLPVDHANEIQSDSATFSLGLYTEQCRHNDGSGMPPEEGNGTGGN